MATMDVTELHLDPPTFTVDEKNPNLELWAFRVPVSLPLSAFKDVQLSPDGTTIFQVNGQEYRIQVADLEEMESFRVLIPQEKGDDNDASSTNESNDDDEDEDNDQEKDKKKKGTLRPCRLGFTKHFQVLANTPTMTESQLAPREGPTPQDKIRHAYAPIAQRTGLKRRWMPVGAHQTSHSNHKEQAPSLVKMEKKKESHQQAQPEEAESPPPNKRKRTEVASDDSDSSSEDDKNLTRAERKAKKAEKKAAKKAKKEAKKAKKAAKKAKKDNN